MKETLNLDGKEITLVGTAHISSESRDEVREVIEDERPEKVFVELDESRLQSLRNDSGWKDLDVSEAIRDGKGNLLLLNVVLSIYQRKLGLEEGMKPGSELLAGIDTAKELGIDYHLVDQDINVTLNNAIDSLSVLDKIKIIASFLVPGGREVDVEELKESDMLSSIVEKFEKEFPELKETFLDDRNAYMAEKILEREFESAVVVVGAAHVEGLREMLENGAEVKEQNSPKRIPWLKAANYGFVTIILLGLGFSFYSSIGQGITNLGVWIGANSILAAIGAIIARSHPVTWGVSFIASPFTSINPAVPAGLIAAYSESRFNPPTVGDLEDITKVTEIRELWGNQMGRILLTFFLVNLGSAIGSISSGLYIITSLPWI